MAAKAGSTSTTITASAGRGPERCALPFRPTTPDLIYGREHDNVEIPDAGQTFTGFNGAPCGEDYQPHLESIRVSAYHRAF